MDKYSFLHIKLLLKRFLLALFIAFLCRFIFLLFNLNAFPAYGFGAKLSTFYYGILFDVSSLIYFNSLFIILHVLPLPWRNNQIYQKVLKGIFIIVNAIFICLNLIDSQYYRFSGRRSGADLFTGRNDIDMMWLRYFTDFWFLFPILAILILVMVKFYPKLKHQSQKVKKPQANYFLQLVYMVLILGFALIGIRGGFGLKPIRPFDAARFVPTGLVPLALNTPFQVLSTVEGQFLETPDYMTQEEAESIFPVKHKFNYKTPIQKKNVVIIILESFGKEYVGYFNNGKGYTPFLDSLCGKSLLCTNAFANGKRSSDAIPSIYGSLPALQEVTYINSVYSANKVQTLGAYLQKEGFYSGFFHGARNGSMGFDNFLQLAGNGEYFGLTEYPDKEDFDDNWGIFDEPYLQYFARESGKKPRPFLTGIFTISSHHPYPVPEKYKGKFPPGTLPIHKAVGYADHSLKQFFIYASRQKWFKNTLFVITADHSAENERPQYQNSVGKYAVPMLFYTPDGSLKGEVSEVVSHVDILPSILDYLHYNKPFFSFGKSIFHHDENAAGAVHYDNGLFQYIKDSVVLHFDGNQSRAMYKYRSDSLLQHNILGQYPDLTAAYEMELKALLQVYFARLNNNEFTVYKQK